MNIVNEKKIILGSGAAGLITAYYNKDAIIIGEKIKGQMNNKFLLGPRIIQFDEYTYELCKELFGINRIAKKNIYIGYSNNNKVFTDLTEDFKINYSILTRGTKKVEKSFLSDGKNKISIIIIDDNLESSFDILLNEIVKILQTRNQLIQAKIFNINCNEKKIITDIGNYHYKILLNTIPLDIFNKLLQTKIFNDAIFQRNIKHYYYCKLTNLEDIKLKQKYFYIYSIDNVYTRKTYENDFVIYETSKIIKADNIDGNKIIDKLSIPIQIKKNLNCKFYNDIYYIGRYAQWNHGIKLNEIIKRIKRLLCVN